MEFERRTLLLPEELKDAIVIDGHADTPQRFVDEGWDFDAALGDGHLNLEAARHGGLSAEFFAIWVQPDEWRGRYAYRTLQLIDGVHEQLRRHPHELALGLCARDVRRAHAEGRFCILLGIEGGHSIENSLALLRIYHRLGVRYMTLTWANSNEWADSSGDMDDARVAHHNGLTHFGREVVREMNRLGMMVDVSHVSDKTFWDVMETTRAPVIASHSSARALASAPRNLTDEQLRAVTTCDGIVMVNFYSSFVDDAWREMWSASSAEREDLTEAASAEYRKRGEPVPYSVALKIDREYFAARAATMKRPSLERVVDHIDHVAKIAGIDHVGIGTDFDGFGILPEGLQSAADLPKIYAALTTRGYTGAQMRKILGENLLRVMDAVQGNTT
ncbi:MAG TPA: dipeptidase [Candidatus Aquilonibacter sp.]|nr:dipeptidase [Candidatus Aquilonibacter sp.]